ncbi:hypothetical protein [Paenibacillus sp. MMO-177]|uniref:hypothetical protein n=1 Tax=Paenibacillus sp. MMO-177 TaxID=3081289 RepID=UPI003017CA30
MAKRYRGFEIRFNPDTSRFYLFHIATKTRITPHGKINEFYGIQDGKKEIDRIKDSKETK